MYDLLLLVFAVAVIAGQAIMLDRALNRAERAERRLRDTEHILRRYERQEAERRRLSGFSG